MSIKNNVQTLIPDTEDIYTADIRYFFITVASLVPNDFMDISVEAEQPKPLTSSYLKKIYDSSLHTTKKSSPPDFHRFRG